MTRSRRLGLIMAPAILVMACASPRARGAFVATPSVAPPTASGGLFTYDYTITNPVGSDQGVSGFFLNVDPSANLTSLSAPTGFDIAYLPGDPDVSFTSSQSSFDIPTGQVGLFSFKSPVAPQPGAYLLRASDQITDLTGNVLSPVPEPSGLLLFALGGLGLFEYVRRRRHQPTTA